MKFDTLLNLLGKFSLLFFGVAWFMWRRHTRRRIAKPSNLETGTSLWVYWLVSVFALFIYGFLGAMLRRRSVEFPMPISVPLLLAILSVLGFMNTVLIFTGPLVSKISNYGQFCTTRFAFAQATGIYGFLLFMRGTSWIVFGIFLAWALALELLVAPTQSNREKFLRVRRQTNDG